jgi:predicted TIM-barrel fold metal-dependent hydrolase
MITDAQVHLFEPDTPSRPWPRDGGRVPPQLPEFGAEQMLREMDAIGVDRAVIVPPVWAGDHNLTAIDIAAAHPDRFAIMGRLDPFAAETAHQLETWLSQPNMLGIRLSSRWGPHMELVKEMLAEPSLNWFWESCEGLGIPIMCLARDAIGDLERIPASYPNLRLTIDHLGTVDAPTLLGSFAHLETLLGLARYPNVYVKVSTAPNHSEQPYPFTDVHPILRRVYDAFGSHRMMWAADITQLRKNTYAECLRLWQEGLPFLSASDPRQDCRRGDQLARASF